MLCARPDSLGLGRVDLLARPRVRRWCTTDRPSDLPRKRRRYRPKRKEATEPRGRPRRRANRREGLRTSLDRDSRPRNLFAKTTRSKRPDENAGRTSAGGATDHARGGGRRSAAPSRGPSRAAASNGSSRAFSGIAIAPTSPRCVRGRGARREPTVGRSAPRSRVLDRIDPLKRLRSGRNEPRQRMRS